MRLKTLLITPLTALLLVLGMGAASANAAGETRTPPKPGPSATASAATEYGCGGVFWLSKRYSSPRVELRLYYDWNAETVCGVVVHTAGWYGTSFNTGVRVTSPWDSQADWGYYRYYAGPRTVPLGHDECVSTVTVDEAGQWNDSFC